MKTVMRANHANAIDDLSLSGPLTVSVNGGCMGDSLPDGSAVKIRRCPIYWPGDVLVFRRGDRQMVSHRMLGYAFGRSGWKVITRADRESLPDAPHSVDRVLGKCIELDGTPYRPGLTTRARSASALVPALCHLFMKRFSRQTG